MSTIGSFGAVLKAEREAQGYSIDAVSEETKIRSLYLRALEEEKFNVLPPRVYAVGFVKRYAQFLQLDTEAWSNEFQRIAYPQPTVRETVVAPRPRRTRKIKVPVRNIVAAAFFLLAVIWAGNFVVGYITQKGVTQPPSAQQPQVQQPQVQQPAPQPQTTSAKLLLVIDARQKCWLQVRVDEQQTYTATINPGDQKTFEASSTIDVKAGNAGGIDLTLNNRKLPPLGEVGQVAEQRFDIKSISNE